MRAEPLFSEEDADLAALRWTLGTAGYAQRWDRSVSTLLAHRAVMRRVAGRALLAGEIVDHIDGNRLNCRRDNLRITDAAGNSQHVTKAPRGASGVRGVYFEPKKGVWAAQVAYGGMRPDGRSRFTWTRRFKTKEAAAAAARAKRIELGFLGEGS